MRLSALVGYLGNVVINSIVIGVREVSRIFAKLPNLVFGGVGRV
jgi:hypothetical protein